MCMAKLRARSCLTCKPRDLLPDPDPGNTQDHFDWWNNFNDAAITFFRSSSTSSYNLEEYCREMEDIAKRGDTDLLLHTEPVRYL